MITINNNYSKNEKQVFCKGKAIPNADPDSFTLANAVMPNAHYFAFDKNQVYALSTSREGLQVWPDVHIESLQFFSEQSFFADKNHLYYFNWHFIEYANQARYPELKQQLQARRPQADAWWNRSEEYYQQLQHLKHSFYTDGLNAYFYFETGNYGAPFNFGLAGDLPYYSLLPDVHLQSFEVLNEYYARDKNQVYHLSRPIAADAYSFTVIDKKFGKDKNGTWFDGFFCAHDVDEESFEILTPQDNANTAAFIFSFAKDKNVLYASQYGTRIGPYQGYAELLVPLKNSDPESFEIINNVWARDKNNVYRFGETWKEIDATSFKFLFTDPIFKNNSFAVDKNALYNANGKKIIKGVDGNGFVALNELWGRNNHQVFDFVAVKILKRADAASFKVTEAANRAEDDYFVYEYGIFPLVNNDFYYSNLKKRKKK